MGEMRERWRGERGRGEMGGEEGRDGEREGRDEEGGGGRWRGRGERWGRGGGGERWEGGGGEREMGRGEGNEWPGIKLPSNLLCTATPMSGNLKGIVINSCCGLRLLLDKPPSLILLTSNTQIPHENKPSVVSMLHFLESGLLSSEAAVINMHELGVASGDGILWYFVVALCIVLLPRGNCRLWELVGTGGKNLR